MSFDSNNPILSSDDTLASGLFQGFRSAEIGEPLGQVDGTVTHRKARHLADDGFGEVPGAQACESGREGLE